MRYLVALVAALVCAPVFAVCDWTSSTGIKVVEIVLYEEGENAAQVIVDWSGAGTSGLDVSWNSFWPEHMDRILNQAQTAMNGDFDIQVCTDGTDLLGIVVER